MHGNIDRNKTAAVYTLVPKLGHSSLSPRKQQCNECHENFHEYDDLVGHMRKRHHAPILRCHNCGQEFVKESDRYYHLQEEKAKKLDFRRQR
ncbi:MAG: hypothetical protein GEU26_07410 [Nitrososphaeraceae archaeon]|nr:hypothetical protein [Nitrososphaeraceae archaeon]